MCVTSTLTLILIISMIGIGIGFYVKEYPTIQRVVSYVSQLEDIDVTQIKEDVQAITESVGELQEMSHALSQISNKTEFVRQIVYIVNYACDYLQCDADQSMASDAETVFSEGSEIRTKRKPVLLVPEMDEDTMKQWLITVLLTLNDGDIPEILSQPSDRRENRLWGSS